MSELKRKTWISSKKSFISPLWTIRKHYKNKFWDILKSSLRCLVTTFPIFPSSICIFLWKSWSTKWKTRWNISSGYEKMYQGCYMMRDNCLTSHRDSAEKANPLTTMFFVLGNGISDQSSNPTFNFTIMFNFIWESYESLSPWPSMCK